MTVGIMKTMDDTRYYRWTQRTHYTTEAYTTEFVSRSGAGWVLSIGRPVGGGVERVQYFTEEELGNNWRCEPDRIPGLTKFIRGDYITEEEFGKKYLPYLI